MVYTEHHIYYKHLSHIDFVCLNDFKRMFLSQATFEINGRKLPHIDYFLTQILSLVQCMFENCQSLYHAARIKLL